MARTFEIVLWSFNLEAANLKYHNCCNKNFANFKGLEESKADLAFLLKSQALCTLHKSL